MAGLLSGMMVALAVLLVSSAVFASAVAGDPRVCRRYAAPRTYARLNATLGMADVAGLAMSRKNEGVLWMLSGDACGRGGPGAKPAEAEGAAPPNEPGLLASFLRTLSTEDTRAAPPPRPTCELVAIDARRPAATTPDATGRVVGAVALPADLNLNAPGDLALSSRGCPASPNASCLWVLDHGEASDRKVVVLEEPDVNTDDLFPSRVQAARTWTLPFAMPGGERIASRALAVRDDGSAMVVIPYLADGAGRDVWAWARSPDLSARSPLLLEPRGALLAPSHIRGRRVDAPSVPPVNAGDATATATAPMDLIPLPPLPRPATLVRRVASAEVWHEARQTAWEDDVDRLVAATGAAMAPGGSHLAIITHMGLFEYRVNGDLFEKPSSVRVVYASPLEARWPAGTDYTYEAVTYKAGRDGADELLFIADTSDSRRPAGAAQPLRVAQCADTTTAEGWVVNDRLHESPAPFF